MIASQGGRPIHSTNYRDPATLAYASALGWDPTYMQVRGPHATTCAQMMSAHVQMFVCLLGSIVHAQKCLCGLGTCVLGVLKHAPV